MSDDPEEAVEEDVMTREDEIREHFEQSVESLQKAALQLSMARTSLIRAERSVEPKVQNSVQSQRIRVERAKKEVEDALVIVKSVSGLP